MLKFHTWVLASLQFWQQSKTAQFWREPRPTPGLHGLAGCCHFALESWQRIFFSMRTGNLAEVPAQLCTAGLAIPGAGASPNLQLPLTCVSLSKDPSSVTSTSAMAAADISLHRILTRHKGKNRRSCLKPWLCTARVSVHLCPRKHVPAMCVPASRAMESRTFVLCRTWELSACKQTDGAVNVPNCNQKKP